MPDDPHRPLFHFTPGQWMNDSVPFFWDGEYHYFFLHHAAAVEWGHLTVWGHAVSRDLAHWTRLPDAFGPTPGGPDQYGCWTGCVVEWHGTFYAFYTAIPEWPGDTQLQCLATSRDLLTWEKHPGNPLGVPQPPGFGPCFRDPMVWREGDGWAMIVGGERTDGKGGAAFLYRSPDLVHWDYRHPLCVGEAAQTRTQFECPDFFPLGATRALISSQTHTWWQTGAYTEERFTAARSGPADGGAFYAAKTLLDDRNRRLLLGWVRETRPGPAQQAAGWSGCLSLPRLLSADADGSVRFAPPPELERLRGRHRHWDGLDVPPGGLAVEGVRGDCLEILVRFAPSDAARYGLAVRCAPDGPDGSPLLYDRASAQVGELAVPPGDGDGLTLHTFVDRSIVETFLNGRVCLTQRTYPARADALGVRLLAEGGAARVLSLDVWALTA